MTLQWIAADLATGQLLADLPDLIVDYPIRRTIAAYETATAHLPVATAPAGWEWAIREGGALLACYDDAAPVVAASGQPAILWAGFVVTQDRTAGTGQVDLALATLEGYFDRRYVGNYSSTGAQFDLVADLIEQFISPVAGNVIGGINVPCVAIPWDGFANDLDDDLPSYSPSSPSYYSGPSITRSYLYTDMATVYQRLTELCATQGGGEFSVDWRLYNNGTSLQMRPSLFYGPRVHGNLSDGTVDLASDARVTFEMPGSLIGASQTRDYSAGSGANAILAYSSGDDGSVPMSPTVSSASFNTQARPLFEYHFSPSTSITNTGTLYSYASRAFYAMNNGARAISLTATLSAGPYLGIDWFLGDIVDYQVGGPDAFGNELVPEFPGGLAGTARVVAYEINADSVSPIVTFGSTVGGSS